MTACIAAVATYVPQGRLSSKDLRAAGAGGAPAGVLTFAVPGVDEDVITMGAEAAEAALASIGLTAGDVGALFLATCSGPYAEHSCAVELARAIDVHCAAPTVDLAGTTRGAVPAIRLAADTIEQGRARVALVVAADLRRGRVGAGIEGFGSGAVAVVVTRSGAPIGDLTSCRHGVPTRWRPNGTSAVLIYDDARYERDGQMLPALRSVLTAEPGEFLALGHADARSGRLLARALGRPELPLGDEEVVEVGDLGTAAPLLALAHCLSAVPSGAGHVVAVEPGSGADCLAIDPGPVVVKHLRPGVVDVSYVDFLRSHGELLPPAPPDPVVPWAATPGAARDDLSGALSGVRCVACDALSIPAAARCVECGAREVEPAQVPRRGYVVTHNRQHVVALHPEVSPVSVGVARLDGENGSRGGQVSAMFCGRGLEAIRVGTAVELVYRRLGVDDGLVKYGWKLRVVEVDDDR